MKLETKLRLKTALMVCVMLMGTALAHWKLHESDEILNGMLARPVPTVNLDAMSKEQIAKAFEADRQARNAKSAEIRGINGDVVTTLWTATALAAVLGGLVAGLLAWKMGNAITTLAERADAIACGDLSLGALKLDGTEQVERLAAAMDRMQQYLRQTMKALGGSSSSLSSSTNQMRAASEGVHRRMDQQNQQTQQAATAMAEMSASIAEVSRHTQDAAQTARDAAATARSGGEILGRMLVAMDQQWAVASSTATVIEKLNSDAGKISGIVNVIGDIARKTNLLALNAAIEAARAGEQGRGFGVVAGEVRRLAESTAAATGEIAGMIGDIQRQTNEAFSGVDAGRGGVAALVETTKKAGQSLDGIIGMAERVERMIAQIAIATQQQAAAADQSSASLDAIHSLSDGSLTEMAESEKGVERLGEMAVEIERQMERFLLEPVLRDTFGAGPAGYPPIPFAAPKRAPLVMAPRQGRPH